MEAEFTTTDLMTACYLVYNGVAVSEVRAEKIIRRNGDIRMRATWVFDRSDDNIDSLITEFQSGMAMVEPKEYWHTVNQVRTSMRVELGEDRIVES